MPDPFVQEYYGDYQAVDPYHFTVNAKTNYAAYLPLSSESSGVQQLCERSVEAITAVFLSLKKRPVIRYQKTSEISRRIAQDAGVGPSALCTLYKDVKMAHDVGLFFFFFFACVFPGAESDV